MANKNVEQKDKYKVIYEIYTRSGESPVREYRFLAGSQQEMIEKLVEKVGTYYEVDEIKELIEEGYTCDEILDQIFESNGDGCDFIIRLVNVTKNEVIYDGGEPELPDNEW